METLGQKWNDASSTTSEDGDVEMAETTEDSQKSKKRSFGEMQSTDDGTKSSDGEDTLQGFLGFGADGESGEESSGDNPFEIEFQMALDEPSAENDPTYAHSSDDGRPLVSDDDEFTKELMEDPYFREEIIARGKTQGSADGSNKRRKLNTGKAKEVSPWESQNEERRKQETRAKLELLMMDESMDASDIEETDVDALSKKFDKRLKKNWHLKNAIKRAMHKKLNEMDEFQFDADDSRFGAIFADPEFALDPTNPRFQRTAVTSGILEKRRE